MIVKYLAKSTTKPDSVLLRLVIVRFILTATILVLGFAYLLDRDLTLAARFQFFYFPAVLLLVAVVLADNWVESTSRGWKGKSIIIFTLLMGFLGGLTVINNYGYTKPDRPDLVVPVMMEAQQIAPQTPILVATVHKNHEQTGEMMGIAWEWQKARSGFRGQESEISTNSKKFPHTPRFLLLHKDEDATIATKNLYENLALLPRPLDIWLVNFAAPDNLEQNGCSADKNYKRKASGYRYRLYHCL